SNYATSVFHYAPTTASEGPPKISGHCLHWSLGVGCHPVVVVRTRNRSALCYRRNFRELATLACAHQYLTSRKHLSPGIQPVLVVGSGHHFGTDLRTSPLPCDYYVS